MTMMLEKVQIPHRKRWTRAECRRLKELGFLPGRYELIDGEIIQKMGMKPPHRIALMLLAVWLENVFGRLYVQSQCPIVVNWPDPDGTEPEPDAAVTQEPVTTYQNDNPNAEDIVLVAEVSDTTLDYDLNIKAKLYAAAGIADYWVLDVKQRRIHVHRRPTADGYHETRIYTETEAVAPLARPDASILAAALLPPVQEPGADTN